MLQRRQHPSSISSASPKVGRMAMSLLLNSEKVLQSSKDVKRREREKGDEGEDGEKEEEKKEGRAERDSARNVRSWITDQRADCVLTEHPSAGFLSPSPHGKMQWKPLITVGMERIRKRSLCRLWALLPIYPRRTSCETPYWRRSSRKPTRRPRHREMMAFFSCMAWPFVPSKRLPDWASLELSPSVESCGCGLGPSPVRLLETP